MILAMATTKTSPAAPATPRKRATKIAAAPAIRPAAPQAGEPVDETPTPAGPAPVTIVFREHIMPVLRPNEAQLALLIDASQWMSRARLQLKRLGEVPAGAGDDHPLVQAALKSAERGLAHVGRLQRIIGSLFENEDDWDWICEQMAGRLLPWQEVADLPALIIGAHNEADRMMPDNRETRRAAGGRGKRV
jgi:hypothetical protein